MQNPELNRSAAPGSHPSITWIGWLELGALFLAGVYALLFQVQLPTRLPTDDSYRALAARIADEARPADVVLLYPWWSERARLFLPADLPVVGYLGSDADPLEDYARVWLIAQPDLPRSNISRFLSQFGKGRTALGPTDRLGALELSLFKNDGYRPKTFSAVENVSHARVYVDLGNSQQVPCPFDGQVHRCPMGNTYVGAEWHEIHFSPQRCLWMRPPGGAARLVAEFSGVASSKQFVVRGGLTWDREYFRRAMTSANIQVQAGDGQTIVNLTIDPGVEGLHRIAAPGDPVDATHTLRLSVASENPELRDICVEVVGQGTYPREGA